MQEAINEVTLRRQYDGRKIAAIKPRTWQAAEYGIDRDRVAPRMLASIPLASRAVDNIGPTDIERG